VYLHASIRRRWSRARGLQSVASVLSLVAILTLAFPAAGDGVCALERISLPALPGSVTLRVEPLESRLVLSAPHVGHRLAKALRARAPSICPHVEEAEDEVRLGCRSRRLSASMLTLGRSAALEIRELSGLPVAGDEGFPLLPWDTAALGLSGCPGETPAARGECLLAHGDRNGARRAFAEADGDEARGPAALRLGDLALLDGDSRSAGLFWLQATAEPWNRLGAARACEISDCSSRESSDALFRGEDLPAPLAADLAIHGARAAAYRGRLLEAAVRLRNRPGACEAVPGLCDRVLLAALRGPAAVSEGALLLYLADHTRERGPLALELALAAAARAQASGAPEFAGNSLAAVTSLVPNDRLPEHLLRTAEVYVAAGDRVRAGVVLEYARVHLGRKVAGSRWAAVRRALKAGGRAPSAQVPNASVDAPELATAMAALERARALTSRRAR